MARKIYSPISLHYAWIILVLVYLAILMGSATRSAASLLITPLENDFGWTRAAISSVVSVNLLLYGLGAPVVGRLIDKFGPRLVTIWSLVILAAGVAGTLYMNSFWQLFILWGIVISLGSAGLASVLPGPVVNHWFKARQGLFLGILNSASSTGQVILQPLLLLLITGFGWRQGLTVLIPVTLISLILSVFWLRNNPEEVGLKPYGEKAEAGSLALGPTATEQNPAQVKIAEVLHHRTFWLLVAVYALCGGTALGLVGTHLIPYSQDHKISDAMIAIIVGVMGAMNFLGTIISGWLSDKISPRRILLYVFAFRGLALVGLPFVLHSSAGLFAFAVIYGLDWAATVAPVVTITGATFGKQALGTVYGLIFMAHQIGASLMAAAGGLLRVWLGDYWLIFILSGVAAAVASALAWGLPIEGKRSLMSNIK
ncbi:MFS transporter [Paradesulfitobacterium ferrireducens]|uniref:MFS transporter n=1 Tax=Paradesulfitobacterium ferrireducens TaxID=2816476 RepID=UPI001A9023A2|nr:MFS transporter [Paradesulfitobacterium ferrireducens]